MKYSADYIRAQLSKYITKYMEAVHAVGEEFLWGKGLTIEDYLLYISQPGNRSNELSIYLVSRFCQKYVTVITKDSVWFTRKNASLEDCHIVLVYWGGGEGTYCDTKLKSAKPCRLVGTPRPPTSRQEPDSDFVYEPELPWGSPVPCRHTRSIGTPPLPDDSDEPVDEPVDIPKWK